MVDDRPRPTGGADGAAAGAAHAGWTTAAAAEHRTSGSRRASIARERELRRERDRGRAAPETYLTEAAGRHGGVGCSGDGGRFAVRECGVARPTRAESGERYATVISMGPTPSEVSLVGSALLCMQEERADPTAPVLIALYHLHDLSGRIQLHVCGLQAHGNVRRRHLSIGGQTSQTAR